MRLLRATPVLAVLCAAMYCNPQPNPPPNPKPAPSADAGPLPGPTPAPTIPPAPGGDAFDFACAAIKSAGCSEGLDANCAKSMRAANGKSLTAVPVDCLQKATTKAAVRACGHFVECR